MKIIKAAVVLVAMASPALAIEPDQGVNYVVATVEMRVAAIYCGLYAPEQLRNHIIGQALDFTGMNATEYTVAMVLAADKKAADINQAGGMARFCAGVKRIYEEQR